MGKFYEIHQSGMEKISKSKLSTIEGGNHAMGKILKTQLSNCGIRQSIVGKKGKVFQLVTLKYSKICHSPAGKKHDFQLLIVRKKSRNSSIGCMKNTKFVDRLERKKKQNSLVNKREIHKFQSVVGKCPKVHR